MPLQNRSPGSIEDADRPVEHLIYREAMSRIAASVHLVTTDGPGGRAGLTATSVTSVSDEPATLLVCLNATSSKSAAFLSNQVIAINTLTYDQSSVANAFASRSDADENVDRFSIGAWAFRSCPVLEDALVSFECRIVEIKTVATHLVIFAEVLAIGFGPDKPGLIYANRKYAALSDES